MCPPRADTQVGPYFALVVSFALGAELVSAQTRIRAPANKYTPAQDVQLGRKAEAQVRQQLPMLNDAQIAAYDPRDMAAMFRIIAQRSGGGGPEWLSDHPNPGNRSDSIRREARMLRVNNARRDTRQFQVVRARLRQMPPAPTTRQITQR